MPYCSKCGQKIDENMTFCPKCGAPLKPGLPESFSESKKTQVNRQRDEKAEKDEKQEKQEKNEKDEKQE